MGRIVEPDRVDAVVDVVPDTGAAGTEVGDEMDAGLEPC